MDPFHVARLAGDALDRTWQRVQQDTLGHRGHAGDPLYDVRRTLHTGADFLTEKQTARLEAVFATDENVEVEATWGIYQRIVAAYREPDKQKGKQLMQSVIDAVASGVPAALVEIRRPGRPLLEATRHRRARVLRPAGHIERTHGSYQWQDRTPPRIRPRLPQPHQPHRPQPARSRRVQTSATPSFVKSQQSSETCPRHC